MIVCICNNVSEAAIAEELKKTPNKLECLGKLGVGNMCGSCLYTADVMYGVDSEQLLEYNYNKSGS